MMKEKILEEAKDMREELVEKRRYLHANPETEFNLIKTLKFVESELINMGYDPIRCGKSGLIAIAGGKKQKHLQSAIYCVRLKAR